MLGFTCKLLTHVRLSLSRETNPPRQKSLAHVIGMREVKHRVTDQDHQLVMFATKCARERLILSLHNYAFPHPLPELLLGGPELFAIATNDQRRFLFLLLLFFLSHFMFDKLASSCQNQLAVAGG